MRCLWAGPEKHQSPREHIRIEERTPTFSLLIPSTFTSLQKQKSWIFRQTQRSPLHAIVVIVVIIVVVIVVDIVSDVDDGVEADEQEVEEGEDAAAVVAAV